MTNLNAVSIYDDCNIYGNCQPVKSTISTSVSNATLNGSFWQISTNQNVGSGNKLGSFNLQTTGNITADNNITSGNSTHYSRMNRGTITNVNSVNTEISTNNVGNFLTHNGVFVIGSSSGFSDSVISNVITNNVNYTGSAFGPPVTMNTNGISNGVYVQGSHSANGEEFILSESNAGLSNTVVRSGTQSGYTHNINNYGVSNTVSSQTKTTTGGVVTENNYGGHFSVASTLGNNAQGSLTKNNYGFYAIVSGTVTNQDSTCYGAYVSSSSCDTNWAYYSANTATSYFGGNVTVVQDILGRKNLNITGNSTLSGNNRLGVSTSNFHGINTPPNRESMLFTAFTYNRQDISAYGINNNIGFEQNSTIGTLNVGFWNRINIRGINYALSPPSRIKFTNGILNVLADSQTLNGTMSGSEIYATRNEISDTTTKISYKYIRHYGVYNQLLSDLGTNGTLGINDKYAVFSQVAGTGNNNYGEFVEVSGATNNWGFYNNGTANNYLGHNNAKTYFTLASSITYNGTDLLINPKEVGSGKVYVQGDTNINGNLKIDGNFSAKRPYGMFSSTENQTIAAADTAYPVTFNWTEDTWQIALEGMSNITFQDSGDYLVELSAIVVTDTNNKHIEIWVQITNSTGAFVNVPRSNTKVEIENAGTETIIAVPFILDIDAGNKFRLMWASDDVGTQLAYTTNTSYSPETPSIIMTLSKISEITD
jgi:hypothetical protein